MTKRTLLIGLTLIPILFMTTACSEEAIPLNIEVRIVKCEDQRQADPLMPLVQDLLIGQRRLASRLALASGRIGSFPLWQALADRFHEDPIVSDALASATLFPGTRFDKALLFQSLMKLPYTPTLCKALLNLGTQEGLDAVQSKGHYHEVIAENLWRMGPLADEALLQKSYATQPYATTYSLSRLRKKGIVKAKDIWQASPFTRCVGALVCDSPETFLSDPDWRVRASALRACDDPALITPLLSDPNPLTAAEAMAALGRSGFQLSQQQCRELTFMQAQAYLSNQKNSGSVPHIYAMGGDMAKLAAPFMPPESREAILASELPLGVKLSYIHKQNPSEAVALARSEFTRQKGSEALQFLLENEALENLSDIVALAQETPDFRSLLIEYGAIKESLTIHEESWYREAITKIRSFKGFTLVCDRGEISCHLLHDQAPLTVYNFITLAEKGYYDGSRFHRVVPAFVCQGGDPTFTGSGGPGYAIRCEYNTIPYNEIGVMGMALSGKDTGGSQFFLTHLPTPHLDYNYTVFARMVRGVEVLNTTEQGHHLHKVILW